MSDQFVVLDADLPARYRNHLASVFEIVDEETMPAAQAVLVRVAGGEEEPAKWLGEIVVHPIASLSPATMARHLAMGSVPVSDELDPDDLAEIVRLRCRGYSAVPAGAIAAIVAGDRHTLVVSERQLLREVAKGGTFQQIAERVGYSERHVRRVWRSLRIKSGRDDRTEVLQFFGER